MRYASVCSGIEAATVAWHPLGWEPAVFSEIEKFPRAVLAHHYPHVPLHGDFTTIGGDEYGAIDLLVGGTPCQSFSIAGLRKGLDDDRGNLALEYLSLADRMRPGWLVWENVPGVLSSNGGRDFGAFLGGLAELGYGWAYRVLDAQFVRVDSHPGAVPQRRRRVFVIGYSGDWRPAAAVLFEPQSMCGHPPPRRESGQGAAPILAARTRDGGGLGADFDLDGGLIASTGESHANAGGQIAVAFNARQDPDAWEGRTGPLDTDGGTQAVLHDSRVRRLTPRECERLQGFPDDYTRIPWRGRPAEECPDGPRYKALGNSMAVNCMRWIGERIALCEEILASARAGG